MNFEWPEEYTDYKQKVIEFSKTQLNDDDIVERDKQSIFAEELWQKCADFGIQGLASPSRYGGTFEEVDLPKAVLAMEGLGYGCRDNGLVLALNAQMWAVMMSIVLFGNEEQKQKFLPKLCNGEWKGCHGLTEESSGSDVFSMKMTAERQGDVYILNWEKRYLTLSPISNMAVVFANSNPSLGKWGVTAFLVEKTMPGFTATPSQDKMGLRTAPFGRIKLENCPVPVANRLGAEGAGFSISNHSLEYDRCCIMAGQVGTMDRQIEECVSFAKERVQFGKPISDFQSVTNRIANMKLRLETARLLLYKLAWLKKHDKPAMLNAAMLKLHLSEVMVENSLDFIRIHGGKGYLSEHGIERDLRDAVGGVIYAGTSDIQRNIIAKFLGL